jgi:glutathione synthase/RimK-type ligase-like ATP-grasp enzyme
MRNVFEKNLNYSRKRNGYWLAGLDFIFDEKLRPWLLEINANPGMDPTWNTEENWQRFFVKAVEGLINLGIIEDHNLDHDGWIKLF